MDAHWEPLGRQLKVLAAKGCGFSTDTLLLADFSMPKRNSACADLGSGCGVIPLLWGSRAKPKSILALDVQGEALELMRASVKENGMEGLITPVQGDIRDYRRVLPHQALDLAASNPPYFPPGSGAVSRDPLSSVSGTLSQSVCGWCSRGLAGSRISCCWNAGRAAGLGSASRKTCL